MNQHQKNKTDHKSALFKRILPELKRQTPYFSLSAVRRAMKGAKILLADETLREYMSVAMASGVINGAGRGWYSRHDNSVKLGHKPVGKIIHAVKKLFPLLDFSCWSTLQLNPFARHLIAQPIIFLYAESDTLASVAERLKEAGWSAWANPKQAEVKQFVRPGERAVVLRPAISKQPEDKNHSAPIEKVMVDLVAEAGLLSLMDQGEVQRIIDTVLESGLIQIPVFIAYMERRRLKIESPLITH